MNETFGKYRLTDRLAMGGMAEVYRAEVLGEAGFAKPVVIKRLHARFSEDESFTQMLIDEARITSRLIHPNICQVLDLGSYDDSYYLALEFIAGDDLKTIQDCVFQRGERLPVEAVLFIATEMLAGLDYAHRQMGHDGRNLGVVHRDISPHNILVSYEGEVKIIDFGIAKARMRLVKTAAGVIKGKFRYMSPEQASAGAIDHRSDQFAAAVVIYEMLRGSPHSTDVPDIEALRRIREAQFEPLTHSRYDLSDDLTQALHKALSRDPICRFSSCGQFRSALLACLRRGNKPFGRGELAELMRHLFSDQRRQQRSANYSGPRIVDDPPKDSGQGSFDGTAQIIDFSQSDALPGKPPPYVAPPPSGEATQASRPAARAPASPPPSPSPAAPPRVAASASSNAILLGSSDIELAELPKPAEAPEAPTPPTEGQEDLPEPRPRRGPQPRGYLPPRLAKQRQTSEEVIPVDDTNTEPGAPPELIATPKPKRKLRGGRELLRTLFLLLVGGGVIAGVYFLLDIPGLLQKEAALLADQGPGSDGNALQGPNGQAKKTGPIITLQIHSQPSGATVSLCKRPLEGRTPLTASYQTGERCSIVVSKPGYRSQRRRLDPNTSKSTATLSFKLRLLKRPAALQRPVKIETIDEPHGKKQQASALQVTSMQRAKVFINGAFRGYTPKLFIPLSPGTYDVWLTYTSLGTSTAKKRVRVNPSETSKVHFEVVQ